MGSLHRIGGRHSPILRATVPDARSCLEQDPAQQRLSFSSALGIGARCSGRRGSSHRPVPVPCRIYAVSIVIGSVAGFVSALMSTSGIPAQIGFILLALAWLLTMWKGYQAARARRFTDHRIWMIRNYALTFAAVLLGVSRPWQRSDVHLASRDVQRHLPCQHLGFDLGLCRPRGVAVRKPLPKGGGADRLLSTLAFAYGRPRWPGFMRI